jgi:16S rRNA (guanine966-N2)-methyltransferase
MLSERVDGARAIDVFAGTGSLGIEALSRGAQECLFFESSAEAAAVIRENLDALRISGRARLVRADYRVAMARSGGYGADIAFIDPPYASGLYEEAMQSLVAYDMIVIGGIAALESSDGGGEDAKYPGFELIKKKRYGKTFIRLYERTGRTE